MQDGPTIFKNCKMPSLFAVARDTSGIRHERRSPDAPVEKHIRGAEASLESLSKLRPLDKIDPSALGGNQRRNITNPLVCLIEPNPLLQPILGNKLAEIPGIHVSLCDSLIGAADSPCPDMFILDRGTLGSRFNSQLTQVVTRCSLARIAVLDEQLAESEQSLLIKIGVHGFMAYSRLDNDLPNLVWSLMGDKLWFEPTVLEYHIRVRTSRARRAGCSNLTSRQEQIVSSIRRGLSNKEIGAELRISESTVKFHVAKIFDKLGVRNRRLLSS